MNEKQDLSLPLTPQSSMETFSHNKLLPHIHKYFASSTTYLKLMDLVAYTLSICSTFTLAQLFFTLDLVDDYAWLNIVAVLRYSNLLPTTLFLEIPFGIAQLAGIVYLLPQYNSISKPILALISTQCLIPFAILFIKYYQTNKWAHSIQSFNKYLFTVLIIISFVPLQHSEGPLVSYFIKVYAVSAFIRSEIVDINNDKLRIALQDLEAAANMEIDNNLEEIEYDVSNSQVLEMMVSPFKNKTLPQHLCENVLMIIISVLVYIGPNYDSIL